MYHVKITVLDATAQHHVVFDEHDVEDEKLARGQVESARDMGLAAIYEEVEPAA